MQECSMIHTHLAADPAAIMPTFAPINLSPAVECGEAALDGEAWWRGDLPVTDEVYYLNSGTCPECNGAMIRLGTCFSCPVCGYGSCGG
jgi:hypothetical protein